ncbi:MAG TPA: TolC family protein, partial [Kofleriaceae bacterium]
MFLALLLVAGTAAAQPAPRPAPRQAPRPPPPVADDMAAFERDLDALFASGGLTADQAASRAAGASPTVRRRAAEIEAAVAQTEAASLARVPVVSARASYTRLSHVDPPMFAGMTFGSSLDNAYLAEAQLVVPLSDYLLRYPKLIDAARLGADAARIGKRSSEVGAGQDARLAYYEWVRARLQVLI